ncbi:MAG: Sulfurtransferase TusA [Alphaproteobacteria bacterium MarineAlpha6_Bin3]|nr:MAG: Sulfurtransferase TusA [Alphaproteobacteria bacterium MarineAlpha6_Bin3]|tara:strand:- start:3996 stop:4223 length:228 start_codon:yes stop_codon:yes gene_type:complete
MVKKTLDVKGIRCPIPVLKAEKVLKSLKTGDILQVLTTDPKAIKDFQAYCEVSNCLFQSYYKKDGVIKISICKSL